MIRYARYLICSHGARRRRLMLHVFAVIVAVTAFMPQRQQAHAATSTICTLSGTQFSCPYYSPPDLLVPYTFYDATPEHDYSATAAQIASVQALETEAINNTIADHGLPATDVDAVKSWGRYDAEAELFALIVKAIRTPVASRTTDQQNVVDWLGGLLQAQSVGAAEGAASEYVKWAGLDPLTFQSLLYANNESALESFLSTPPEPYSLLDQANHPLDPSQYLQSAGGYCIYRSPAPYQDEYTGYNDGTCFAPCNSVLGCNPPTPSYDQFVKWGEGTRLSDLLTWSDYQQAAGNLAMSAAFGGAVAGAGVTGVALSSALSGVLTGSALQAAVFPYLGAAGYGAAEAGGLGAEAALELAGAVTASSVGFIVGTVLVAVAAAVLEGLTIGNAAALPGKLATLVVNAHNTTPDLAALLNDPNGAARIYSLFASLLTPVPTNSVICDNAALPNSQGQISQQWENYLWEWNGQTTLSAGSSVPPTFRGIPCLNPPAVPPALVTDPHFVVVAKDSGTSTTSPTITAVDQTLGITTTTRLMGGHWFISKVNGSAEIQMLRIPYTDWSGKEQTAWLMGNATDGWRFAGVAISSGTSTAVDPATCAADGTCWSSSSLNYVGSDGGDYSATVQAYSPPTGTPTYSTAVEASPVTFAANGYTPGGATDPITYTWQFQKAGCGIVSCTRIVCPTGPDGIPVCTTGPDYTDPVSGDTASYTWQTSGTYQVQLTATTAGGQQAVDDFSVNVGDVPPTLSIDPFCAEGVITSGCDHATGDAGTSMSIDGEVTYAGSLDTETVAINWGDGSNVDWVQAGYPIRTSSATLTPNGTLSDSLSDTHVYTTTGSFHATVVASDWGGGTDSKTFVETIGRPQTIDFPTIPQHTYGDTFAISATGGASGSPVTFTTGDASVCALSNASGGSATVTALKPGTCTITASQAGSASYWAAPVVTRIVDVQPAPLTITASSPSSSYGSTVPAIVPSYSGFTNNDTASSLTTQPTCSSSAPNSGAVGAYPTTCAGAVDPNYQLSYVPGTLTIAQAPLTISANNKSMTYGASVPAFDAAFSGLVNGDTSSVVSGLTCGAVDGTGKPVSGSTPAGTYTITCSGGAAANYAISYQPGTLSITKAGTSVTLASAPAPAVFGQPVTITAKIAVTSPGAGNPGGTVEFKDGGTDIGGCSAQPVSTTTETATCTTSSLGVASHGISASYTGDANFTGSGTTSALAQTVTKAASSLTLVPNAPATQGQAVTFTAVVVATAPGAGTPSGTVIFYDGGKSLGSGTLGVAGGTDQATFSTSSLGVGPHTITASYGGDGNFTANSSTPFTQYVNTNLSGYPKLPSGAYNLSFANLAGAYLVGVSLAGANLTGANLTNAVFTGADLTGAGLSFSNMRGANLTGATLSGANLSTGNFMGATFTNVNLRNAILSISNFKGASFSGANLSGANLTISNLTGATGLKTATLTNLVWSLTQCPDGSNSNRDGGTCLGHL